MPLDGNETASFIPSYLITDPTIDPTKEKPFAKPMRGLFNRVMSTRVLKSDEAFFKRLKMDIEDHAENRLQLIWQQFLMTFQTNLEFSYSGKAQHQAGLIGGNGCSVPLQEAHCSTLP